MKTIFDKQTRDELINRIHSLNENSTPQWGKMNIYQMLKHCTLFEDMISGRKKYKLTLPGRLFGKMVLKTLLKDGKPMPKNSPTVPELRVKENGDVASEKAKWIALIEEHAHFSNDGIIHPFFGKMTIEQIGYLTYIHYDHHLRQFKS